MRTSYRKYQIAAIAVSAILAAGNAAHASIETYNFYNITNNGNPDVGSQLSVEVSDAGGANTATFSVRARNSPSTVQLSPQRMRDVPLITPS